MEKEYKVIKQFYWIDTWLEYNIWEIVDFSDDYTMFLLWEYIEEIKEEEKPKFRIWSKVVVWEWKYWVILNIHIKDDFEYLVWTSWVYANQLRKPTEEEIEKYFN